MELTKPLSLGPNLKYPITITRLLKKPGDEITKQISLLEYKFTWMKKVGDPLGDEWEEEQTSYGAWDSPAEGTISSWLIKEGQRIERDRIVMEVKEACPHSVQFAGLCGMCGKDMTEVSWASASVDADRAKINMIHDQTHLTVTQDEASKAEEQLQRRLLKSRKLSLVVDLDQTIIHACIEPTVGEWQRDPNSPNYEAVKDVRSFQLKDDSNYWYYIKMRPGLIEFLEKVSEMYELHVYTMGTRTYAINIAKIVDPKKKLFGDRIISRDENGNVTAKSLARLFPQSTHMVVIIDDRSDVWPMNRLNLIKVVPYDFFLGVGDINSSFLPKREELPKVPTPKKKHLPKPEKTETEGTETVETPIGEAAKAPVDDGAEVADGDKMDESGATTDEVPRVSALEELVRMGGGDDELVKQEQAAEQEKFLERQLTERPLLHMQEQLDKQDDEVEEVIEETKNGGVVEQHPHIRHNLLKDDDVELMYLQQHLTDLHKAFYEEYDKALVNVPGGRVAQLKPGGQRKISVRDEAADLKIVPNIAVVMPRLKAKVLQGCVIVMSGIVPSEIAQQTEIFGAKIRKKVSKRVTHVVASSTRTRTQKVRQAAKYPHIKIVTLQWLLSSMSKWKKDDEEPYLVEIHPSDRRQSGDNTSLPSSMDDSDDSEDYTGSESNEDDEPPKNNQEDGADDDGVMPDDIEPGHSPIDDLKGFDWNGVDDELAEFMGDDDDSATDSDGSMTSNTTRGSRSSQRRGQKRSFDEATDEDTSDEESTLVKKQRMANARTTSLKTVKTPTSASESSLPTPGVTGDENEDVTSAAMEPESDHSLEEDLEAEMEAAFEREQAELEGEDD
ncbi:FCP1-like phosphatase protein [Rutstroemia sp. NJR-2017a BBW]|nr:FCP1-like phosphatase protein [Rutstroemia sp. NJR-2017a BBW]